MLDKVKIGLLRFVMKPLDFALHSWDNPFLRLVGARKHFLVRVKTIQISSDKKN